MATRKTISAPAPKKAAPVAKRPLVAPTTGYSQARPVAAPTPVRKPAPVNISTRTPTPPPPVRKPVVPKNYDAMGNPINASSTKINASSDLPINSPLLNGGGALPPSMTPPGMMPPGTNIPNLPGIGSGSWVKNIGQKIQEAIKKGSIPGVQGVPGVQGLPAVELPNQQPDTPNFTGIYDLMPPGMMPPGMMPPGMEEEIDPVTGMPKKRMM